MIFIYKKDKFMSDIKKRNLLLEKIIFDVKKDPDDISNKMYMACILLLNTEIENKLKIDIDNLQKVLVSLSQQKIALMFKYVNKNQEKCKDILITKKLLQEQINKTKYCLPDNAYVVITNDEGYILKGKKVSIEIKE